MFYRFFAEREARALTPKAGGPQPPTDVPRYMTTSAGRPVHRNTLGTQAFYYDFAGRSGTSEYAGKTSFYLPCPAYWHRQRLSCYGAIVSLPPPPTFSLLCRLLVGPFCLATTAVWSSDSHVATARQHNAIKLSKTHTRCIRTTCLYTYVPPDPTNRQSKINSSHFESNQGMQLSMASDHSPTNTGRQAHVWYRSIEV